MKMAANGLHPEACTIHVVGAAMAALLHELHIRCFSADTGERWRLADFADMLNLPDCRGLIAERRAMPAGYALARFCLDECELLSLGILPENRQQGLAGALLAELAAQCRQISVRKLFLEVREDNHSAISFYEKQGFSVTGRRPGYYRGNGENLTDALTLARLFD